MGGQCHTLEALPMGGRPIIHCTVGGWAPGPVWTDVDILPPPRVNPRTVQPVVSCYVNYAISAHQQVGTEHKCWKVKVNESHYKPGLALKFPGGWGSQISRQLAYEGGKVVSPMHRLPLPTRNIPGTHFCYRLSRSQGLSAVGRIKSMKSGTIGNWTCDLLACSAVPQPNAPPHTPNINIRSWITIRHNKKFCPHPPWRICDFLNNVMTKHLTKNCCQCLDIVQVNLKKFHDKFLTSGKLLPLLVSWKPQVCWYCQHPMVVCQSWHLPTWKHPPPLLLACTSLNIQHEAFSHWKKTKKALVGKMVIFHDCSKSK